MCGCFDGLTRMYQVDVHMILWLKSGANSRALSSIAVSTDIFARRLAERAGPAMKSALDVSTQTSCSARLHLPRRLFNLARLGGRYRVPDAVSSTQSGFLEFRNTMYHRSESRTWAPRFCSIPGCLRALLLFVYEEYTYCRKRILLGAGPADHDHLNLSRTIYCPSLVRD